VDVQVGECRSISARERIDDVALQEGVVGHEVITAVIAVALNLDRLKKTLESIGSSGIGGHFNDVAHVLGIELDEVINANTVAVLGHGDLRSGIAIVGIASDKVLHISVAASPAVHLLTTSSVGGGVALEDGGAVNPGLADVLLVSRALLQVTLLQQARLVHRDPGLVALLIGADRSLVKKGVLLGPVLSAVADGGIPRVLDDEATNSALGIHARHASLNSHIIVPAKEDHSVAATNDVLTKSGEDTLTSVAGKDELGAAAIRGLGAWV